jgi:multicomponent Na+:H+ antiporter subunit C
MSLVVLLVVSVLFGTGTYLALSRSLARVVIGLALISHGANLFILVASTRNGAAPLVENGIEGLADPLPQAMVLTAIVITFGVTAFLLALALRSFLLTGSDAVEDDIEDRRIARAGEPT